MSLIESLNAKGFEEYLVKYQNTICGRHPIAVLLHVSTNIVHTCKENHLLYTEDYMHM